MTSPRKRIKLNPGLVAQAVALGCAARHAGKPSTPFFSQELAEVCRNAPVAAAERTRATGLLASAYTRGCMAAHHEITA